MYPYYTEMIPIIGIRRIVILIEERDQNLNITKT